MRRSYAGNGRSRCRRIHTESPRQGQPYLHRSEETSPVSFSSFSIETTEKSVFEKAESVRSEYVLLAKGTVRARESVNTEIKTGGIEIVVTELRILSKAQTPPFEIVSNTKTNEELRLKYRYLDLRREPLQKNLMMRHEIAKAAREYFYANGFTEIENPDDDKVHP